MEQIATVGGGCYWCLEAIYKRVSGVESVVSGFSGGDFAHPTSMDVYAGRTGHAECVQLTFDPEIITYREILEIFFTMHNPTTLNCQDYDVGEIYRSVIFYHDDEQRVVAEDMLYGFAAELWDDPVVTQLAAYDTFWPADESQQDFYENNPNAGYCLAIINPKVQKLRKLFGEKLLPES